MSAELNRLAEAHGISLAFFDEMGTERLPSDDAKRRLLSALGIPAGTDEEVGQSLAALESPLCYIPPWLEDGRAWGITCQLYALRSARNWGIGDFEDLARLAELAAPLGADFIGINPLHALFFADHQVFSPYTPSSRRFLNPLYIAIEGFTGLLDADRTALEAAREAERVDYEAVARLKHAAFETQFARFQADHLGTGSDRAIAFEAFSRERGERLENFALFEALSEVMAGRGLSSGWQGWPAEFRDKDSGAVGLFRDQHRERVLFHKWLQWVARDQLANAQERAAAAGMRIGLYLDLAVGVAQGGADTWSEPESVLRGVRIGSPPDAFNASGQDWGLAPISPRALKAERGRIFRDLVTDAIGPAGAFRIDHAMAMMRLYLIADGLDGTDGAYVHFPFEDMLNAACAASQATHAVIVGEDLGTVPANFRETLRAGRIQGYRVLFFERDWDDGRGFRLPDRYERDALACVSTHDLPTLHGWWEGTDIDDREAIGLDKPDDAAAARVSRETDRRMMMDALAAAGLLPDELGPAHRGEQPSPPELPESLAIALSRFLARTPCRLVAIQLEDLAAMRERMNLPGTVNEQPNWRRRFPLPLEALFQSPNLLAITQAVAEERPKA